MKTNSDRIEDLGLLVDLILKSGTGEITLDPPTARSVVFTLANLSDENLQVFNSLFDDRRWERDNPVPVPVDHEKDVHTEHCCRRCHCKYGDDNGCSVASGRRLQSYPHGEGGVCN